MSRGKLKAGEKNKMFLKNEFAYSRRCVRNTLRSLLIFNCTLLR